MVRFERMKTGEKPIRLSQHAQEQARQRGATEEDVRDAIRSAAWGPADAGRLECQKEFVCGRLWQGRSYQTKRVRPIFVDEPNEIVVVTVYVCYF